ncbi:hypothetical protein CDAR_402901 [Caerostris darwini]|uniref:Uncharacterized protein n=1 Tax=Caerostris darwini TaxID=1538125 RepID=A0AAV4R2L0_9ARAC|nr:hypothetical protein CDAR_402901 [Caerostris darwini]
MRHRLQSLPSLEQQYDGPERLWQMEMRAQRDDEVVDPVGGKVGGQDDAAAGPVVLLGVAERAVDAHLQSTSIAYISICYTQRVTECRLSLSGALT